MSDPSAKNANRPPREIKTAIGVEALGLIAAGLSSTVIPKAASLAIKLKWLLLLGSLLPLWISHFHKKQDYFAAYRVSGIWFCNTLVLLIAYFFDNQYFTRGILESGDYKKFFSEGTVDDFGEPACIIFGILGIFYYIFCLFPLISSAEATCDLKRPIDPLTVTAIILGGTFSAIFWIPHLPAFLCNFFVALQVIIPSVLLIATLSFPTGLSPVISSWALWVFIGLCIVSSPFSVWAAAQIAPCFLVPGILCVLGYIYAACALIFQSLPHNQKKRFV